eukprot:51337-Amphidinium_carterae.1
MKLLVGTWACRAQKPCQSLLRLLKSKRKPHSLCMLNASADLSTGSDGFEAPGHEIKVGRLLPKEKRSTTSCCTSAYQRSVGSRITLIGSAIICNTLSFA